jgi:hypothetical protein
VGGNVVLIRNRAEELGLDTLDVVTVPEPVSPSATQNDYSLRPVSGSRRLGLRLPLRGQRRLCSESAPGFPFKPFTCYLNPLWAPGERNPI